MEDLANVELFVDGQPIATLAEMRTYAYGVPEDHVEPPTIITRFIAGEDVDAGELHRALVGDGRAAVSGDDAALEVVRVVGDRLRKAFPTETA